MERGLWSVASLKFHGLIIIHSMKLVSGRKEGLSQSHPEEDRIPERENIGQESMEGSSESESI